MSKEFLVYLMALVAQDNGVTISSQIWTAFVVWVISKAVVIVITSAVKIIKEK